MLSPGGTFIGPAGATPTYTVVPADLPDPGMTVADVMDAIPRLLQAAGIPPDRRAGRERFGVGGGGVGGGLQVRAPLGWAGRSCDDRPAPSVTLSFAIRPPFDRCF